MTPTETIAAQDRPTAQEKLDQIAAQNERDWQRALDGMDRAIAWVRSNRQHLSYFHLQLSPAPKCGVTINLGFSADDDQRAQQLKTMFGGKTVTKRTYENEEGYSYYDADLDLLFAWSVWIFQERSKPIVQEVTF